MKTNISEELPARKHAPAAPAKGAKKAAPAGKKEGGGSTAENSEKRVRQAVYDILVWTDSSKLNRRDLNSGNGTVHFRVAIVETKEQGLFKGQVVFVVDPGWDGTHEDAITQQTVGNFYDNDQDINYGRVGLPVYIDQGILQIACSRGQTTVVH